MVEKNKIDIPVGICKGLTDEQFESMINVSLGMKPLLGKCPGQRDLGKDHDPGKAAGLVRAVVVASGLFLARRDKL